MSKAASNLAGALPWKAIQDAASEVLNHRSGKQVLTPVIDGHEVQITCYRVNEWVPLRIEVKVKPSR